MKDSDIKKVLSEIQLSEERKISVYHKIKIKERQDRGGIFMKMSKMYLGSALMCAVCICGVFIYTNANNMNNVNEGKNDAVGPIPGTAGVSEMVQEKLAVVGNIQEIKKTGENDDVLIRVMQMNKSYIKDAAFTDIVVNVNASTNIFLNDKLLEISDLKVGQNVSVYYDGVEENGQIEGLRVEISK